MKKNITLRILLVLCGITVNAQQYARTYQTSQFLEYSKPATISIAPMQSGEVINVDGVLEDGFENTDVLISKIGTNGEVIWKRRYGTPGKTESANSVSVFAQDNYALIVGQIEVGFFNSQFGHLLKDFDVLMLLIDTQNGDIVWSKSFGEPKSIDRAWSIKKITEDGIHSKFIVLGEAADYGSNDASQRTMAFSMNGNGTIYWKKRYVETSPWDNTGDVPNDAVFDDDGNLILIGNFNDEFETAGLFTLGVNPVNGNITNLYKRFGHFSTISHMGAITAVEDGFLVTYASYDLIRDLVEETFQFAVLTKLNENREPVWSKRYSAQEGMLAYYGASIYKRNSITNTNYDILLGSWNNHTASPILMTVDDNGNIIKSQRQNYEQQVVFGTYPTTMVPAMDNNKYILKGISSFRLFYQRGYTLSSVIANGNLICANNLEMKSGNVENNLVFSPERISTDFGEVTHQSLSEFLIDINEINCDQNKIANGNHSRLSAYPNPIPTDKEFLNVEYTALNSGKATITIKSINGIVSSTQENYVKNGINVLKLKAEVFNFGLNFLVVSHENGDQRVIKIIKE
ncbi:T9SS type A sorting domain-containing protein [uncultured Psychroserpens sp.]|uniref:T9SS type A sorting domain-containing protein n=1 Tax=uncultured Psychroserpens sp. TaxID=255436 RepID=UPI00261C0C0A|nr:T9SS type A sorting domain-containing protein [uncultured Psychroserpens sp.]